MKIYKFVGSGVGIPGLAHVIPRDIGDQQIEDYESELKREEKKQRKAEKAGETYSFYLDGHPGCILKAALENKSYKKATQKDEVPAVITGEDVEERIDEIVEESKEVSDG